MGIPQPNPQPKVPVVRRPEYTLSLEQATLDDTFIHCDIRVRWTPTVFGQLREDWAQLQALHGGPFRAMHTPGDRRHLKFITLFGFHKVASYVGDQGPRDIYST